MLRKRFSVQSQAWFAANLDGRNQAEAINILITDTNELKNLV